MRAAVIRGVVAVCALAMASVGYGAACFAARRQAPAHQGVQLTGDGAVAPPAKTPTVTLPVQPPPPTTATETIVLPTNAVLPTSIGYHLWNGAPVLDLLANGSVESFVIDSGLNADSMSPAGITRLQMSPLTAHVHAQLVDRSTEVPQATLKSLRMGLFTVQTLPMASLDVPAFLSRTPHPGAPSGWLGTPFLSAFQVTFDPILRTIIFDFPKAKPPAAAGKNWLPITIRDGRPYVSVAVPGGKPFDALLDSGVVITMIPKRLADKLHAKPTESTSIAGSDGKPVKLSIAELKRVMVGKAEAKDLRVAYLADDTPGAVNSEMAVLGMDFFSRFKTTINLEKKRLYLVPVETPLKPKTEDKPVQKSSTGSRSGGHGRSGFGTGGSFGNGPTGTGQTGTGSAGTGQPITAPPTGGP